MKILLLSAVALLSACLLSATPSVTINVDDITNNGFTCSFSPDSECTSYYILADELEKMKQYDDKIESYIQLWGIKYTQSTSYTWKKMRPNQEYVVYALAIGPQSQQLYTDTFRTEKSGGHGKSVISVSVNNVTGHCVNTVATPDDQTMMFKDFIISLSLSDTIHDYFVTVDAGNADSLTNDSILKMLKEEPYEHYEEDLWQWCSLRPETDYLFIAVGMNADSIWGDLSSVSFRTLEKGVSVENVEMNAIAVYPNPASEYILVNGVETGEMISVVDLSGNVIIEQKAASSDVRISLDGIVPGIYVVRTATAVNKFIVR